MKRTPLRKRGRLKAGLYIALFGSGEDDERDGGAGTSESAQPHRTDPTDDAQTPEE
jgi:hypothetical protein